MKPTQVILTLLLITPLFAKSETFIREYTYQASDYDSKVTSRANSLEQVKRILLEEVSVFIKSEVDWTQTEELIEGKYELTDFYENKIQTITAGITETIILDERWTGVEYWIKAELTIDPDDIKRKVDDIIQNKEKLKELDDTKKRVDDALVEIERLKKELAESKSETEQLKLSKDYNKQTDVLTASDWFSKAFNAYENNEHEKAISFYLRCIELDPECANCYYNIGVSYNDLGKYDRAIESYKKTIEINPEYATAYYNMGISYKDSGKDDRAIESFMKAIEINPEYATAYYNMGWSYGFLSKYDKMLESFKKAARLGHKDSQNWLKENGYDW